MNHNRLETLLSNLCYWLVNDTTGFQRIQWLLLSNTCLSHHELTQLKGHLRYLPELMALANQLPRLSYQFSSTIEVFLASCDCYPLPRNIAGFTHACQYPERFEYPEFHGYICMFLIELRNRLLSAEHRYRMVDHEREVQNNLMACSDYVNGLFDRWSRLVVIRIDLGYRKELTVEFDELEADLKRLHTNRRHNDTFRSLCGYIIKIEYGIEKQLHIHAFLFFNGHKRQGNKDSYIAETIGKYWVDVITSGRGSYWNCNDQKHKYKYVGIGLVEVGDSDKRQNLLRAVSYLCKKRTQVIKPRADLQTKLLRKGQLSKLATKLGRPRHE